MRSAPRQAVAPQSARASPVDVTPGGRDRGRTYAHHRTQSPMEPPWRRGVARGNMPRMDTMTGGPASGAGEVLLSALLVGRRTLVHGLVAGGALALLSRPGRARADEVARAAMAGAATAFLTALPPGPRRQAVFPFGHKERLDWHYVPRRRQGVPFKDLPAP